MSSPLLPVEGVDGEAVTPSASLGFVTRRISRIPSSKDNASIPAALDDDGLKSSKASGVVRGYTLKTVYLGLAFCLIFTAFNVAQAYITILYPTIGTLTLATIYGFFALGSLVAPQVGDALGIKWAMAVGSVFFVVFIGCLETGADGIVLLSAAGVGMGSGTLWINQGVWLSRLSANTGGSMTGYFTGLFFTICNANGIVGNILAIILLEAGLSIDMMIWGMFVAGGIGCSMMVLVDPMHSTVPIGNDTQPAMTFKDQLRSVRDVAKMKKSLVILPCIWLQGCNLAFMFGRLPDMLPNDAGGVAVAQVFLCYGALQCIFSYVNGVIYDRFGWKPLVRSFLLTGIFAYSVLVSLLPSEYGLHGTFGHLVEPFLLIGGLLGHLDATLNTAINLAMSKAYRPGNETAAAFGFYRVGFCSAMALMNILGGAFEIGWIMVWNGAWVAVAGWLYERHAAEMQGSVADP
ncbi:DUF895 domain membrane protein, partial [Thoreauomyces humboldtii]